jgi:hypothetical protein
LKRASASEVIAIASNSRSLSADRQASRRARKDALRDGNVKQNGAGIIEVYFGTDIAVGTQSRSHVERVTRLVAGASESRSLSADRQASRRAQKARFGMTAQSKKRLPQTDC